MVICKIIKKLTSLKIRRLITDQGHYALLRLIYLLLVAQVLVQKIVKLGFEYSQCSVPEFHWLGFK